MDAVPLADRVCKARRRSVCWYCGGPVVPGQRIARITEDGRVGWPHLACLVALGRVARADRPVSEVRTAGELL